MGADDIIIGGGGEIFAQTIARASRLLITEVALDADGEARFPPINPHEWRETSRQIGERGPRDEADFAFVEYERRSLRERLFRPRPVGQGQPVVEPDRRPRFEAGGGQRRIGVAAKSLPAEDRKAAGQAHR